jgi:hypothetical protein
MFPSIPPRNYSPRMSTNGHECRNESNSHSCASVRIRGRISHVGLEVFLVHSSFLVVLLTAGMSRLGAQVQPDSLPPFQTVAGAEALLDLIETEADNSELLDKLNWLQEHPLDLNVASREELASIPLLTPGDVDAIITLRTRLKQFASVGQLSLIEDGGEKLLARIRPYLTVATPDEATSEGLSVNVRTRVVRDVQPRSGFQNGSFIGSPLKSYTRLSVQQSENLQAGALFEKDAGERVTNGFASGYLALNEVSFVSHAVIGDYVVEAGQGLVLWRASAFGKGGEPVSVVKKSGLAVQPYRSSDEFNFMRGVAVSSNVEIGEDRLGLTAFYSRRALSASGDEEGITSFYRDGLFRTESELQRKSNVDEKILGGRVKFNSSGNWIVGATMYHLQFSKPVIAGRLYDFDGSSASVAGIDAEMNLGWLTPSLSQITLFGEAARSNNAAAAWIIGSILNFTRGARVALIYRDYSPRFTSLHAAGFGERSDTKNERGFYFGAEMRIAPFLHVAGYVDHFRSPWRTFDNPLPSSGRDFLLQANANLPGRLNLSLRYSNKRAESRQASMDSLLRATRPLVDRLQQKLRLTAAYQASKRVRLRGRIETTVVDYDLINRNEQGWLFYQELQYVPSPTLAVEARLGFFHTDSFDSRVYEYENDLRGVFANPALFGKGRRWYVLVRWNVAEALHLSAKYSETQKEGVNSLGSGLSEIQGDLDNRIGVQVEVKW